ncbi:MAG TPA: F390 synthetase-related protein [Thermoanaerobaculia bacterium]|nr:F390 synthetase-related protein [Thermoanaerobaculia bacterium]
MARLDLARILAAYAGSRLFLRRVRTRDRLERWQRRRLRRALRHARKSFPFYRDVPAGGLEAFPVLDKAAWLAAFRELNAPGLELEECRRIAAEAERSRDFSRLEGDLAVGLSTGTSGRQGVFLASPQERAKWAGVMLAKALPGRRLGENARIALFLRAGSPLYSTLATGRIRFRYFDLRRPLAELMPEVESFDPTVLAAPPQILRLLSAALAARRLRLAPRRVYSIAEVLDPHDEASIGAAFSLPVHQIYQASEGFLGITCEAGRIHLNEDLLVVEKEYLDRATGRFVPVITDLHRRTQAILRFRLGDVLVESREPCPCGSPFLAVDRIEGRFDDVLALPSANGPSDGRLSPLFADYVTRAVLGASPAIADFRCVQEEPGFLVLALAIAADADAGAVFAEASGALVRLCVEQRLAPPVVRPEAMPGDCGNGPAGDPAIKLRRVRRTFPVAPSDLLPVDLLP